MKIVELITHPGELRVDSDKIPKAVENAVMAMRERHPGTLNHGVNPEDKAFDRLFEQVHKCRIEYTCPHTIIWDDDRDYTMFLLKWSSK